MLLEIDYDYLLLWGHYRLMADLQMGSGDTLAIETLEIAHEGLVFDPTDKRG